MEQEKDVCQEPAVPADAPVRRSWMPENPAFIEHLVRRRMDKEVILRKALAILIPLLVFYLTLYIPQIEKAWFIPLLLCGFAAGVLWNYQNMEYEYTLTDEELDVVTIFGRRKRKEYLTINCREVHQLSPMKKKYQHVWGNKQNKVYFAASHINSKDRWFALFNDKQGKRSILIFEPSEEMLTQMRRYAGSNFKE